MSPNNLNLVHSVLKASAAAAASVLIPVVAQGPQGGFESWVQHTGWAIPVVLFVYSEAERFLQNVANSK